MIVLILAEAAAAGRRRRGRAGFMAPPSCAYLEMPRHFDEMRPESMILPPRVELTSFTLAATDAGRMHFQRTYHTKPLFAVLFTIR